MTKSKIYLVIGDCLAKMRQWNIAPEIEWEKVTNGIESQSSHVESLPKTVESFPKNTEIAI